MSGTQSIKGNVERITFFNPETGFTVAKLSCPHHSELICAIGIFPSVQPGEAVRCIGKWHQHPQHGRQFLVESTVIEAPADVIGIRKYLQSGLVKGIGPVYAEKIVARFGEATLEVIDQDPEKLLGISGIGQGRLAKIRECWHQQRCIRDVMVFLQSVGVSPSLAQRIYKTYRQESIPKVRADPYRLAREVQGIGFQTADLIAKKMGVKPNSMERLSAGIEYALSKLAEEGHVCYPKLQLIEMAVAMLESDATRVQLALDHLLSEGHVIEGWDEQHASMIWKKPLWRCEQGVGAEINRILGTAACLRPIESSRALEWVQGQLNLTLALKQKEAVLAALEHKLVIITGGPGTGKSTITRSILSILGCLTKKIILAAPTGKAAKRMTEITGRHAQTIHSLLEWDFQHGKFKRGREYPLACDLLVVDEASMIDTVLAYNLLRAIPSTARLILVGDIYQLPSVGPGNVLKDLISSDRIPTVTLTEIFRQASGSRIVVNAHRIHMGEFPFLKSTNRGDFFFIQREDPQELCGTVVDLVCSRLPSRYHFDPFSQIQVLTPMKRGMMGTFQLNLALQRALNPEGISIYQGGYEYRQGDKVMQIRNNYDKKVFNGDVGRIEQVNLTDQQVLVNFDDRQVTYELIELDEIRLAYAVSIHKFQGSECPCVVIPIHTAHFKLLNRNLLYTAVTRGRKLVVLVGTKKAIAIAVRNDEVMKRYTGLTVALLETRQTPQ